MDRLLGSNDFIFLRTPASILFVIYDHYISIVVNLSQTFIPLHLTPSSFFLFVWFQSLVGYEGAEEAGGKLDYLKILDTNTMIWTSPDTAGPIPETRYGHTMTQVGLHLLFHGGWDGTRPLKDIVALQIAEL